MFLFRSFKLFLPVLALQLLIAASAGAAPLQTAGDKGVQKELYLAGGCFWGLQEYFSRVPGVLSTQSGYAQSLVPNPGYREVCSGSTNAAETVRIVYDPQKVPTELLARHFFRIIDPFAVNRQGNDVGSQYRTGIYFSDERDQPILARVMQTEQAKYQRPFAVTLEKLENFYPAEEYHQDYLKKNPGGYCHIRFDSLDDPDLQADWVRSEKDSLTPMAYHVTRENGTEPPFTGEYWKTDQPGIYVDVISGKPLFSSSDKFLSSCGWPAFSSPIDPDSIRKKPDFSHGMNRVEVRSSASDAHLGHVFNDGPAERGGMRYCINSAALRFIPLEEMAKEGYGDLIPRVISNP